MLGVSVALAEKRQATSRAKRGRVAKRVVLGTLVCLGTGLAVPALIYAQACIEIMPRVRAAVRVNGRPDINARVYVAPEGVYHLFLSRPVTDVYRVDTNRHEVCWPNPQYSMYPAFAINWHKENHGVLIGTVKSESEVRVLVTQGSISLFLSDKDTRKPRDAIEVRY